jgi:tRNA modification GTPase
METVAAIATPPGEGAIALIRISGSDALSVAQRVFQPRRAGQAKLRPRMQHFGVLVEHGDVIDEVLLTLFPAPASFTGEDVVEISCHGGVLVTRRVLELLLRSGATTAAPGEFTRRAYLNGKLDLTQAEAVMDLIGAQSDLALRAATRQLEGHLGGRIRKLQEQLLEVLAHLEAYIDFPEEDIAPDTGAAFLERMRGVAGAVEALLATARQGRVLRAGVRTVLSGAPNVGKSSLLNRLLGFERAIVSSTPGTTRDTLEESVMVRGWPLRLVDTAGLRSVTDPVELEGIQRARKQLEQADLVLEVFDGTVAPEALPIDARENVLVVLNKADLPEHAVWQGVEAVRLSCLSGAGLDQLEDAVALKLAKGLGLRDSADDVAINARHQDCLRRCLEFLQAAEAALLAGTPPEFVAEELRSALGAAGEVVGQTDTEDLLGQIFSTFCIGK